MTMPQEQVAGATELKTEETSSEVSAPGATTVSNQEGKTSEAKFTQADIDNAVVEARKREQAAKDKELDKVYKRLAALEKGKTVADDTRLDDETERKVRADEQAELTLFEGDAERQQKVREFHQMRRQVITGYRQTQKEKTELASLRRENLIAKYARENELNDEQTSTLISEITEADTTDEARIELAAIKMKARKAEPPATVQPKARAERPDNNVGSASGSGKRTLKQILDTDTSKMSVDQLKKYNEELQEATKRK